MFQRLNSAWTWLSNIGVKEETRDIQKVKARIFNYLVLTILVIQLLLWIRELISADYIGLTIITTFCLISITFLSLHHFFGLGIAGSVLNIFFPFVMATYLLLVGKGEGVEYSFFVFMLSAIIFQSSRPFQIFLIIYNISLFLLVMNYVEQYGTLLDRGAEEQSDYTIVFVAASLCFASAMYIFNRALERYDNKSSSLISSLQSKNSKLVIMNEELERFTYIASHDLKTPLRNIVSFLGLMEKRLKEGKVEDIEEYFTVVKDNASDMYRLIEETLEYSKMDQHEWKEEEVDLDLVIDKIRDQLTLSLDERINIEARYLPTVKGDSFYIYKLFLNIIENGIKYNDKVNKKIKLTSIINKNATIISVEDNGIGIEEKYHEQIFTMYKRLHTKEEYQGTGIGLSMCKRIIEVMKGDIWLESQPGKGTTFFIQIPVNIKKVAPELIQNKFQ